MGAKKKGLTRVDPATGELEKLCHKCGEWWPATVEFFNHSTEGYLRSPCKACIDERRQEMAKSALCIYPGCTNPRDKWRYARCKQHRGKQVQA